MNTIIINISSIDFNRLLGANNIDCNDKESLRIQKEIFDLVSEKSYELDNQNISLKDRRIVFNIEGAVGTLFGTPFYVQSEDLNKEEI